MKKNGDNGADEGIFEEMSTAKEKLQSVKEELDDLMAENRRRGEKEKSKAVEKLNYVNLKNKRINEERDKNAAKMNKAEMDSMTEAEKLQYKRSDGGEHMSLSLSIIERNITEGKLIRHANGTVTTIDKTKTIIALPESLGRSNISPVKARKKTAAEKEAEADAKSVKDIWKYYDPITNVEIEKPKCMEETLKCKVVQVDADGQTLLEFLPIQQLLDEKNNRNSAENALKRKRSGNSISLKEYKRLHQ